LSAHRFRIWNRFFGRCLEFLQSLSVSYRCLPVSFGFGHISVLSPLVYQ
jgi:hypothetical protein